METATVGRTGVPVTPLGVGCAPIGDLFVEVGETRARQMLQAAWDAGIRYFDTSPFYGHGKSEHRLGEFLRGLRRDQFTVSTKVGRVLRPTTDRSRLSEEYWQQPLPFTLHFDYSYDGIMRSYEDSLQRLGLGSVELLVIHDLDLLFHPPERMAALQIELATSGWRALEELRSSGAVRGLGAGINAVGLIPRFLDLLDLDFFSSPRTTTCSTMTCWTRTSRAARPPAWRSSWEPCSPPASSPPAAATAPPTATPHPRPRCCSAYRPWKRYAAATA